MNGLITAHQVFLFPDTPLGAMPDCLHAAAALNGRVGIQILFECPDESGCVAVSADGFDVEISQLLPVPVEYNTGNGVDQGGAMVLLPNDRYPLDREVFRLYYTSECEDQQSIDIYFEDNSEPAQLFQLTFDFSNETEDEDTVVTSGGKELPVVIVSQ